MFIKKATVEILLMVSLSRVHKAMYLVAFAVFTTLLSSAALIWASEAKRSRLGRL